MEGVDVADGMRSKEVNRRLTIAKFLVFVANVIIVR